MENELSRFKVLDLGGEIAGYYDLWICADEAHLLNLAVAAPHRRRGYGERMLKDVIDEALGAGCARVVLEVRSSNAAAVGLYAKFGFTKIGRRPHYYADGEAADVMLKNL
jgi:ribosomal-protein-alanine N-acetyltransferase